ncbi:hypothetical protein EJB05_04659, partial [Eragrostis curvula]
MFQLSQQFLGLVKTSLRPLGTRYLLQKGGKCLVMNCSQMDMSLRDRVRKRRDEEDDDMMLFLFPALSLLSSRRGGEKKQRHTPEESGEVVVHRLLTGHEKNCLVAFRMEPWIFNYLADYLRRNKLILDTRIKVEEKLGFFLYMLSRNSSYQDLQITFHHSNDTYHQHINHFFKYVLPRLAREFLKPPNPNQVHPKIAENPRYYPFFKNCLAMMGKGSPKHSMLSRGSPKFGRMMLSALSTSSMKKASPQSRHTKKNGSSPKFVKQRAVWNPELEKSLVEILHEYKDSRGDNGWNSECWNRMVKEFHLRNKYVSFSKSQVQEKEGQLKRDYKMLKAARQQSGSHWNEKRNMVEGSSSMWANLEVTFPKIKKFRNNKATFPLYDALGELHDGNLAEGNFNCTSLDELEEEEPLKLIPELEDDLEEDIMVLEQDPTLDARHDETQTQRRATEEEVEAEKVVSEKERRLAAIAKRKQEKEEKKTRKPNVESMMERYLEMRTKQAEDESAQLAKEKEKEQAQCQLAKEKAQGDDFSVKRCVSALNTMDVTKVEKAKAYTVFKSDINREIFMSSYEEDQEAALIWLREEMA